MVNLLCWVRFYIWPNDRWERVGLMPPSANRTFPEANHLTLERLCCRYQRDYRLVTSSLSPVPCHLPSSLNLIPPVLGISQPFSWKLMQNSRLFFSISSAPLFFNWFFITLVIWMCLASGQKHWGQWYLEGSRKRFSRPHNGTVPAGYRSPDQVPVPTCLNEVFSCEPRPKKAGSCFP